MKKKYLLFVWLIVTAVTISAVNHMDTMTTLMGEFIGSYFGRSVVSLDYNGDGYEDLVISSSLWSPTGTFDAETCYGKIYFFWGGPNFDNVPDFVIEGEHVSQYGAVNCLVNAGDVNGDGIEDLIIHTYNPDLTMYIAIYFGRANPIATPDIVWSAPGGEGAQVYALGDINSDGKDDLSIAYSVYDGPRSSTQYCYIWDDVFEEPYLFRSSDWSPTGLMGIGDINGDGIDDCHLSHPVYDQHNYYKKVAFFGTEYFPVADSLVLEDSVLAADNRASTLGDINGDGYGDFISYGLGVHLGSASLSPEPSLSLITPGVSWGYDNNYGLRMVHGDFNGDGYDDIVASDHGWGYFNGSALIWLGGANMNGTYDLRLYHPEISSNFGYCKATGDFNADGFCDLAISAPYYYEGEPRFEHGKVFIYAGNASLEDTTVANEDDLAPVAAKNIRIYPNPSSKNEPLINLKLSGTSIGKNEKISVQMFNLKGQLVKTWELNPDNSGAGEYQINCAGYAAGIYFILARQGQESLGSTKLLIY